MVNQRWRGLFDRPHYISRRRGNRSDGKYSPDEARRPIAATLFERVGSIVLAAPIVGELAMIMVARARRR